MAASDFDNDERGSRKVRSPSNSIQYDLFPLYFFSRLQILKNKVLSRLLARNASSTSPNLRCNWCLENSGVLRDREISDMPDINDFRYAGNDYYWDARFLPIIVRLDLFVFNVLQQFLS